MNNNVNILACRKTACFVIMDILFIGHSYIHFFDWQNRFCDHRVVTLGVAGESVEGLLSRIDRITDTYPSADIIFIMSGLNNVAMEDFAFLDPYRKILEKLFTAYPSARIFIHSLPPVLSDIIPGESIRTVNDSLRELSMDAGIEFIDIYRLFTDSHGRALKEFYIDDGIHLCDKGYEVWARELEKIINPGN